MGTGIMSSLGKTSSLMLGGINNMVPFLPSNVNYAGLLDGLKDILNDVFEDILDPLVDISVDSFSKLIGVISEKLGFPFKDIIANLTNLTGVKLELSSAPTMDSIIEWVNEVASNLFGIKPFAIMEGKADYIDLTRDSVYHRIVQTIVLAIFSVYMFVDNFKKYIQYPYDAYLRELYELEKLGLTDYIMLNRREFIDDEKLEKTSKFLGYDSDTLENAIKITEFYPSARDLIDFAVREAFEPDENLFIHGKNAIPEPFIEFGKKVGLTDEWIKKFWHSHWRLLSVGQILDAFHRQLITETELLDYLRRLDYTENDQEIIRDLSFNLLTRVDIRRIYENGLMSTKEVFDYYKTLGFSVNDAILMTQLAKQVRFIETKDLRKLYIEQYENGFLTKSAIIGLLKSTGLDSDEIGMYLSYSDMEKEIEFKTELKKQIELRFYEGIIDYDELIVQLRDLGVSNQELKRIESNAVLFNYRKPKLPTMAELKRYLKKNIIAIDKFVYYALRLGYSIQIIEWILRDIEWLK